MKVMMALSGGVDSSVAAGILKNAGHTVCGATLHLAGTPQHDAQMAADALGIPFYEFFEQEAFEKKVIAAFEESYKRGETPNPCIICNRLIKFGLLLDLARKLGQDYLATGHYAKLKHDAATGRTLLMRAKDPAKDQTYMLYLLTQDQLTHAMFPLGDLTKKEIREMAKDMQLPSANKPDSQDICFVPDGDYAAFLEKRSGTAYPKGNFVNEAGEVLGQHQGIIRYTIGQRKGLGIALGQPAFVLSKNAKTNQVILGTEEKLFSRRVFADRLNWIACEKPSGGMEVTAKTRYSHKESKATLHLLDNDLVLAEFAEPQRAPAPGQAMVFYDGDVVVGGGTIISGDKNNEAID